MSPRQGLWLTRTRDESYQSRHNIHAQGRVSMMDRGPETRAFPPLSASPLPQAHSFCFSDARVADGVLAGGVQQKFGQGV